MSGMSRKAKGDDLKLDVPIEAVLFDYDGPTADSSVQVYRFQVLACQMRGLPVPFKDYAEWRIKVFDPFPAFYEFMGFVWEKDKGWIEAEFKKFFSEVDVKIHSGIPQLWKQLQSAGLRIGIASSNLEEIISNKLDVYNVRSVISYIAGFGNGCSPKPAPDCLLKCCQGLGQFPNRCLYVGDMPTDRIAAEAAGMRFVPVPWGYKDRVFWKSIHDGVIPQTVTELEQYILMLARKR